MEPKSHIEKIDRLVRFFKKFNELEEFVIMDFPIYDPNKDLLGFVNSFFIARFYYFSKSILLLLPSLKKDFYFKVPIGILLRTGVSDILTYYYFKYLAETFKNEIAFNDELKGYLVGNLHFIKNQYLWQKKRHQISEAKYKDLLSNLYWKYGEFIDPITSEFIPNKNINFGEIAAKLRSYERLAGCLKHLISMIFYQNMSILVHSHLIYKNFIMLNQIMILTPILFVVPYSTRQQSI